MPERIEVTKMKQNANNREYVLENVKKEGALLEFASDALKDDKEIALEAVHNNPEALEFVSDRLKGDREVVYDSVSKVGWTYCYTKENFFEDNGFKLNKIFMFKSAHNENRNTVTIYERK